MQPTTARVIANPYHALDHNGRPASAVMRLGDIEYRDDTSDPDPSKHTWQARMYIGATLEAKEIHKAQYASIKGVKMLARPAVHDRTWKFSTDPVGLDISSPHTRSYYKRHVDDGGVFAADVESWMAFGNKRETFRDPLALLAEAKAAAIKAHQDVYGADAVPQSTHDHFADVLPKPKLGEVIDVDFGSAKGTKKPGRRANETADAAVGEA